MKVALCTEILYPIYGVERRVYEMAKRLNKYGLEVDLYSSSKASELPELRNVKNLEMHQVSHRTIVEPPKRNIAFGLAYWFNLYKKLLKSNYDIIDANGHLSLIPCSKAGFLLRKPVVATIHDLYLSSWGKMYGKPITGLVFELLSCKMPFTKIITLNTSLKQRMIHKLRINPNKIEIIPSGIDLEYIKNIKSPPKTETILYVGRLVPQKNIDLLLKSFSLIENKKIRLKIIGNGSAYENLVKTAKNLDIDNRTDFIKNFKKHQDLMKEIKKAKLLVLPSDRECFGIVPLEAMALGTPVISTKTEGPMDYIKSGDNGFLTNIGDHIDLKKKIDIILDDKKLWNKMRKNGKITSERYDWENIIKRIADVYKEILE